MNHEPNSQKQHKQACKTYRAIAKVFEDRIDLSPTQKSELIHACYDAVRAQKDAPIGLHLESLQGLKRLME